MPSAGLKADKTAKTANVTVTLVTDMTTVTLVGSVHQRRWNVWWAALELACWNEIQGARVGSAWDTTAGLKRGREREGRAR